MTTIACFQALGKMPLTREGFIMHVRSKMMANRASLKNRDETPSHPTAFVSFRLLMVKMTMSVSRNSGLKHVPFFRVAVADHEGP